MDREKLEQRLAWYEKKYGPYIEKRGMTKENFKNLWRWPNAQEWTILILLIMAMFLGWAYKHDISACQEALKKVEGYQLQGSIWDQESDTPKEGLYGEPIT
jgi:hypothetical protein